MSHPLEKFGYCPVCGSSHFEIHDFKSRQCRDCGFTYYGNASAANVAFIVNENDELLVVRRRKDPAKGTLDLPGGFADMGETGEEGVCREVKEETGLTVSRATYLFSLPNLYVYSGMTIHTLDMFFRCEVEDTSQVHAMDDAEEAQWIHISRLRAEDFGLLSIRQGVERLISTFRNSGHGM